jgi:ubiquinone/menaquinone biosynthesis C-methylase UbiE
MRKLYQLFKYYKKNGILWAFRYIIYYLGRKLEHSLCRVLIKLEQKNFLIGDWTFCSQRFTRTQNISAWNKWDWKHRGEEWTLDEIWKEKLIKNVLLPNAKPGKVFLEFGPGGGRWTEILQPLAKTLLIIDISEKCLSVCKDRFKDAKNIKYHLYDGRNLSFIKDKSIDFVWSYDVFVHINPTDIDCILGHLQRIMKNDAVAVIHHSGTRYAKNDRYEAQRSDMTKEFFAHLVKENGMQLITQLDDYVHLPGDIISIFKPKD